jgi:ATP-binding cassette subfamily B protein
MARSPEFFEEEAKRRPKGASLRPLARLVPYLLNYRGGIAVALVALILAAAAMLAMPIAVRRVVDHGFGGSDGALIHQYFMGMLAVVAVLAAASAVRFYFVTWIGERVVADLRNAVFAHLLRLAPAYHEAQRTGELVSRLTADTTQVKSAFSISASIALRNMAMLIGAAAMMVVTSPRLSGLALLAIPLIVLPLILFGRKVRALSRAAQDTLADGAAFAQERLSAVTAVQAFVQELFATRAFNDSNEAAFSAAARRTKARSLLTAAIIFLSLGSIVCILWYGASEVLAQRLTAGELSQFVLYAVLAASALGELSQVWGEVQLAAGAAERLSEILDEVPTIVAPPSPVPMPEPPRGGVAFENVTFHYPTRRETSALANVSFAVAPGETVALVGPSGAGKTTVFALIERFHDPQSGRVLIDGVDIKTADPEAVRHRIAVVPQETVIFSGSVVENIRFGRPNAAKQDIEAAARAARVDEFAAKLPNGYDTQLGERGVTLSGGQRQRIAIARALLSNAPILLLDEATSSLDAESEALVQEALAALSKGRTTLVIAHRLATVRNADRILVLDGGRLVAEGRHGQLVKTSPLYARLAKLQFSAPSA